MILRYVLGLSHHIFYLFSLDPRFHIHHNERKLAGWDMGLNFGFFFRSWGHPWNYSIMLNQDQYLWSHHHLICSTKIYFVRLLHNRYIQAGMDHQYWSVNVPHHRFYTHILDQIDQYYKCHQLTGLLMAAISRSWAFIAFRIRHWSCCSTQNLHGLYQDPFCPHRSVNSYTRYPLSSLVGRPEGS